MNVTDIEAGLHLCRVSGWNQLSRDWELFLKLSPNGCYVATKEDQVVGTVATLNYENRFAWIAMVLVKPSARGQGVAGSLMQEALSFLHNVPAVRLDATPAGERVYRQLGFAPEYELSRWEKIVLPSEFPHANSDVRPMKSGDLPAVARLERTVFGADRSKLLEWMFASQPGYAWLKESNGEILGYCLGRPGHNAEHIGPVVADDAGIARELVSACLSQHPGRKFYLDVTHHDSDWRSWLLKVGFLEQRPFMRMVRGKNHFPGLPAKQFAIVGPEFG